MKVRFLGTGTSQGVPVIGCNCSVCLSDDFNDKRLRSSIYIKHKNKSIVIDTGPDLRQQVLKNNIKKIDFVLYTHAHRDHVSGIDELRSFNFLQKKEIDAFGNKELICQLKKDYSYIFSGLKYPGLPKIKLNKIEDELKKLIEKRDLKHAFTQEKMDGFLKFLAETNQTLMKMFL